jgi:hypothetical protein
MDIYLDFDGTVVEHAYPQIGRCNFGCIEVIKKLQDSGHKIILNTMRSEFADGSLEQALRWFQNSWRVSKNKDIELKPFEEVTVFKVGPGSWDWDEFIRTGVIFIDDYSYNMPLKPAVMVKGNMVDWDEVDRQFKEHRIYDMPRGKDFNNTLIG